MDLSALIFVALAVAWAVYLIPKALKHHDEVVRSRSVEKFSHTMRILARREAVTRELILLEDAGLLERRRGAFILTDVQAMLAQIRHSERGDI